VQLRFHLAALTFFMLHPRILVKFLWVQSNYFFFSRDLLLFDEGLPPRLLPPSLQVQKNCELFFNFPQWFQILLSLLLHPSLLLADSRQILFLPMCGFLEHFLQLKMHLIGKDFVLDWPVVLLFGTLVATAHHFFYQVFFRERLPHYYYLSKYYNHSWSA